MPTQELVATAYGADWLTQFTLMLLASMSAYKSAELDMVRHCSSVTWLCCVPQSLAESRLRKGCTRNGMHAAENCEMGKYKPDGGRHEQR